MADDPTVARINAALVDSIRAGEFSGNTTAGMVTQWILVGVFADQEGVERHMLLSNDRQSLHATLGLARLADTVWGEEARRWVAGHLGDDS